MTMVFKSFFADGISQLSYLVGDDSSGTAAVIDPRPDVDAYLETAQRREVSITHIFETHIHADFMSGSRELAERTGGARIYGSGEGGAEYGFDNEKIRNGDEFTLGDVLLKVRHTPGHTPEHVASSCPKRTEPILPGASLPAIRCSSGPPDDRTCWAAKKPRN
jgi:hydroxyacylglutathione hydrolase